MALLNMNCPLKEHLVFAKTVEWGARKREGEEERGREVAKISGIIIAHVSTTCNAI